MQSILRTLNILGTVQGAAVVRAGQILCTNLKEDSNRCLADSAALFVELAAASEAAARPSSQTIIEVGDAFLIAASVTETISLVVLTNSEPTGPLLRAAMRSAVVQLIESGQLPSGSPGALEDDDDVAETEAASATAAVKPEPAPAPEPTPEPELPASEADAEHLLPAVLALLTDRLGPVARLIFKHGVTTWKENHDATVGNLWHLAEILAEDLSSEDEKGAFQEAVRALAER
ncbi:MAG: hypothetical protein ACI91F_002867 [Candidatus Binatia bacterium]